MSGMDIRSVITQLYPPTPAFTEANLPDLAGKVYIVTGSNTGVGKELARILYSKNAKVYVAARSEDKANAAIAAIKEAFPDSKGSLVYLHLDLADLSTIKASADEFLAKETALHVLFNNAGVMTPPKGTKTAQGYELQLGTNNLGTFLFTKLLTPVLVSTAKASPPGSVRVIWVSSSAAEGFSERPGGVPLDNLDYHVDKPQHYKYGVSKAGNYLHAVELARRLKADGVVSVALNPGNLDSELTRYTPWLAKKFLKLFVLHPPRYGAYTELFAGLSPDVTVEKSGEWIVPWGRFLPIRKDLLDASKPEAEGGTGIGLKFWEWSEEQVKSYA
ncbi:NAD(P)-binding protein [Pleurostoma richardsiae]|uniref:NAD(P)-binding protein n=1 Tax=Pleurostoma richardsiae TaxID=41990 RepID=A0AA38VLJ8_9PEZI|nr:NAD(P)-binding protein [Pleurostoma richardsiae]